MNRILIVEDEPDIQELLSAYLQQAGYQTSLAGDGVEAWSCSAPPPLTWSCWTSCCPK